MNSRERVLAALECRKPDRVPICEMFINKSIIEKIDKNLTYDGLIELLDIDVVLASGGQKSQKIGDDLYKDNWNVIYKDNGENDLIEFITPIKSRKDFLNFIPPDPLDDPKIIDLKNKVKKFKGKRAILFYVSDSFSIPRKLMGMENLLLNYIADPPFVDETVNMTLEYNLKLIEIAVKEGADIFVSADDYADKDTTLMSPVHFKRFILPGLRKIVKKAHDSGAKYIKHTDGNIKNIIDMLIDCKIDGLHPIDPNAGMNIFEVKEKYKERICLIGNVDCVHTLVEGSKIEVEEEVKRLIYGLNEYGGYMIASSNSIHNGVKVENFLTMIEAAKKYGKYL